jgi:hypothetical protein
LLPKQGDPAPVLQALAAELREAKEPAAAQLRAWLASKAEKMWKKMPDLALEHPDACGASPP